MSAVAKPRIIMKRPVMAKPKPSRRMEQSIFKTIVQMANEMDYADKRDRDLRNARTILMDMDPQVQTTLNPRVLRNIHITRKGEDYVTEPFLYRGISLRFAIFMEYSRYRDYAGKVREGGIIIISPQVKRGGGYHCLHRMMFSRRVYNRIDEFPKIYLDAVHGALCCLLMV